ncbi:hypothetical protein, partial [Enterobacter sp.]|uniref:hypothetical protein n=1 Tax=Enterobacter sp. TaxID=42895 RepID=UPI0029077D07
FVGKTLLHGDVLMWLMKTLLTSGCTNQRGAGQKLINPTISLMMLIVESSSSIFALLLDKAIGLSKACCNRTAKNKCFKSTN